MTFYYFNFILLVECFYLIYTQCFCILFTFVVRFPLSSFFCGYQCYQVKPYKEECVLLTKSGMVIPVEHPQQPNQMLALGISMIDILKFIFHAGEKSTFFIHISRKWFTNFQENFKHIDTSKGLLFTHIFSFYQFLSDIMNSIVPK